MDDKYCNCIECQTAIVENGTIHTSDCEVHNEPAEPKGNCTCKRMSIPMLDAMARFCAGFPESAEIHKNYLANQERRNRYG